AATAAVGAPPATKPAPAKSSGRTARGGRGQGTLKQVAPEAEVAPRAPAEVPEHVPVAKVAVRDAKSDEERRDEAFELIVETLEALVSERGEEDKIWGSMVKQALKRRKPSFNESYYGFRSFKGLLEECAKSGALILEREENSPNYRVRLPAADE
ncbi:MAG: OST-HTH/LOTUS domain-containing protein, partial [Gemmatimonadaceae bacterium]